MKFYTKTKFSQDTVKIMGRFFRLSQFSNNAFAFTWSNTCFTTYSQPKRESFTSVKRKQQHQLGKIGAFKPVVFSTLQSIYSLVIWVWIVEKGTYFFHFNSELNTLYLFWVGFSWSGIMIKIEFQTIWHWSTDHSSLFTDHSALWQTLTNLLKLK